MKKVLVGLVGLLFIVGCGSQSGENSESKPTFDSKGKVTVIDGNQKEVEIDYDCISCDSIIAEKEFNDIINYSYNKLLSAIYHPKTFVPKSVEVFPMLKDSLFDYETGKRFENLLDVYVKYSYEAANSYGNVKSGDAEYVFYMHNGEVKQELRDQIRLDSLHFTEDKSYNESGKEETYFVINRVLSLYRDNEFIKITPFKTGNLLVKTSGTCADAGARLTLYFENEKDLRLTAWNDFNCDSKSYFTIKKGVKEILKKEKVKMVSFYYKGESIVITVPENERDYFSQLVEIVD